MGKVRVLQALGLQRRSLRPSGKPGCPGDPPAIPELRRQRGSMHWANWLATPGKPKALGWVREPTSVK